MYKVDYAYDKQYGWARCLMYYDGMTFEGGAKCHPDDMDFESERVGLTIAEARATKKVLRFIRDHELRPQLKILNHLYSNMRTSTYYNPISYEAKMLRSQIRAIEKELAAINNDLADERKFLSDYIQGKDKLYKRLRAKNQ